MFYLRRTKDLMPDLLYSPCPNCRDGMDVDPHAKDEDRPCSFCSGTTVVGEKCVCGRPARMDPVGYVRLGRYYCGRVVCRDLIEDEIGPKSKWHKKETFKDQRNPWSWFGGH